MTADKPYECHCGGHMTRYQHWDECDSCGARWNPEHGFNIPTAPAPRHHAYRVTRTSDDTARAIYQSTDTYEELQERYGVSYDVIRDIRCARGRWTDIVAGLTRGETHGRNGHGDPKARTSAVLRGR